MTTYQHVNEFRSDEVVLVELGTRLSAMRLAANMTQAQLAREAGVSKRTLERIEAGQSAQITNLVRVLRALKVLDRLETLLPAPQASPMDLLKRSGKTPQRASGNQNPANGKPWRWGDDQ